MDIPGHPEFKDASFPIPLSEMRRLDRAAAAVENATLIAQAGAAGTDGFQFLAPPPPLTFLARITSQVSQSQALYTFQELFGGGPPPGWPAVAGGMISQAYEINGNNGVPADPSSGAIVRVWAASNEQFVFAYFTGAGTIINETFNYYNDTFNFFTANTINVFNTLVENVFATINYYVSAPIIFQPPIGTVPGPTGPPGPTGLPGPDGGVWIFLPLKIDDWLFLPGNTYTVTGADFGVITGTWDDWIPPIRGTVWRIKLTAHATLTGIFPAAPPPDHPANGQVLWLINCSESSGPILTLSHLNANAKAGNRFFLPGSFNVKLPQGGAIGIWYDTVDQEWKTITMESGGPTGAVSANYLKDITNVVWDPDTCDLSFDKVTGSLQLTYMNGRIQTAEAN